VITDNGRVEQRLLDLDTDLTEDQLSELRSSINSQVAGKLLSELAESVGSLSRSVAPQLSSATSHIATALSDSIQANRQQKLVMAGTANLVRTEEDFHGSIYPVLDAIEEQVILLKLLSEMKSDAHEVAVSIGREHSNSGLEQTSLLATGYTSAGESATLGLLGPTRMDYSNNIASIRAVARYLTRVLDAQ
jgi:heat-inducible transcriptional repressor